MVSVQAVAVSTPNRQQHLCICWHLRLIQVSLDHAALLSMSMSYLSQRWLHAVPHHKTGHYGAPWGTA